MPKRELETLLSEATSGRGIGWSGENEPVAEATERRQLQFASDTANENPWLLNAAIGAGRAVSGAGQSIGQMARTAGNFIGAVSDEDRQRYDENVTVEDRTFRMLTDVSPAAYGGEIAGQVWMAVVPVAGYAGAVNKLSTAQRLGAYMGIGATETMLLNPVTSDSPAMERTGQAAVGALGGAVGLGLEMGVRGLSAMARRKNAVTAAMSDTEFVEQVSQFSQMAGVDWAQVPPAMQRAITQAVLRGADSSALMTLLDRARTGVMPNLARDFPYTSAERGYLAGERGAYKLQADISGRVYGDEAADSLENWKTTREGLLGQYVSQRVDDVGGAELAGNRLPAPIGETMMGAVRQRHEVLSAAERSAWDELRAIGPDSVIVNRNEWQQLHSSLLAAARNAGVPGPNSAPAASDLVREIMDRMRAMQRGVSPRANDRALGSAAPTVYGIDELLELRRMMQQTASLTPNDQRIISSMRRQFDDWLQTASRDGRITVQNNALNTWERARLSTTTLRQFDSGVREGRFGGDMLPSSKLVQDIVAGRVTPEKVVQDVFGATGSNANTGETVRDLLRVFGDDPRFVGAMRQGALLQIFGNTLQTGVDGAARVQRGNFVNRMNNAVRTNRTGLVQLFGDAEIREWETFLGHLRNLTKMEGDRNVVNLSGTAYTQQGIRNRMRDWLTARMEKFNVGGSLAIGVLDPAAGMISSVFSQQIRSRATDIRGRGALNAAMGTPQSPLAIPTPARPRTAAVARLGTSQSLEE